MVCGSKITCSDVSVINSAHTRQLGSISTTFLTSWLHPVEVLPSSGVLRSPVFHSNTRWMMVPITALLCVVSYFIFICFFLINVIELLVIVWSSEELRGAERVPMFPVSPANKAESVPCSFIGTVCCEHVPSLCSLHLKAFQALHFVFCHNNGLVVYPRGRSDAQTCKAAPPPFLSVTAISLVLVFAAENGQLWENHQNHAWKKKVKTH